MGRVKKLFLSVLIGILGLLLTLAGFNLLQLSNNLVLYSGLILIAVSVIIYIF